jgi:hypothetical protein
MSKEYACCFAQDYGVCLLRSQTFSLLKRFSLVSFPTTTLARASQLRFRTLVSNLPQKWFRAMSGHAPHARRITQRLFSRGGYGQTKEMGPPRQDGLNLSTEGSIHEGRPNNRQNDG